TQQAIGLLLPVPDDRLTTDAGKGSGCRTDFQPLEDAHHAEAVPGLETATDHVQIARLEQLQIQDATGEKHGIEGEQWQSHSSSFTATGTPPAAAARQSARPSDSSPVQ